jgi:disulfide bond formation protein DsbB
MQSSNRNALLLSLAWLVAIVATLGSLYYSEIRHFIPCKLCWYQRIMMYPQVLLLGIALWRNDFNIRYYSIPMVVLGACVSVWHLLEQRFPDIFQTACDPTAPCSAEWIPSFPIPLQALIGFILIALSLSLIRVRR